MMEPRCQYSTENAPTDVPAKAMRLARRVAALQQKRAATRHTLEVIMLPDGSWLLMVNGSATVEYLGNE